MSKTVNSTDDNRTINNVMRHEYRVLSDAEKAQMQKIKDMGLEFHTYLMSIGKSDGFTGGNFVSRELALAGTKVEEAVMWAVKHITAAPNPYGAYEPKPRG